MALTKVTLAMIDDAVTGTGDIVLATSPTLITPDLGTPSALVGTNITGTAAGLTAGTVTTNANLTGPITSTGNATAVAAQTGTGSVFVMQNTPTLTTPVIGAATGTSLVLSGNLSANNIIDGFTTTATAAGTTTLTNASTEQQFFTGTTTQTVTLPTTSVVAGQQYRIVNLSTGVLTVNSSGGNLVQTMAANTIAIVTALVATPTTAANWSSAYGTINLDAATQANQETGTSTTTFVSPGRQQYHPSAAKAWIFFDGASTPASIQASYNVSSLTDNATGNYSVNFTVAMSSTLYCAVGGSRAGGGAQSITTVNRDAALSASVFSVYTVNPSAPSVLTDTTDHRLVFFGDQ